MTTNGPLPTWNKVSAGPQPKDATVNFALTLDGVVQYLMTVNTELASLLLEQPKFILCNEIAQIGMTEAEATAVIAPATAESIINPTA